jgi:succinate dehydrogenase / fumarate reductase membrane anchor subunit
MVTAATAFGRSGLQDWIIQRVSALLILAFVGYLGMTLLSADMSVQDVWKAFFATSGNRVFAVLALLGLVAHAWIGLWTVSTDYIKHTGARFAFQVAVMVYCLGMLVWGIQILWGL